MLIENINPAAISRIGCRKQSKRIGKHPLYYRLQKKKYPFLHHIIGSAPDMFDGIWWGTAVLIFGLDGELLKSINCKSRQAAHALRDQLEEQLNDYSESLVSPILNRELSKQV